MYVISVYYLCKVFEWSELQFYELFFNHSLLNFFSHPQESTGGVSPTREQARREAERKVSTYTAVCLYKYLFTFSLLLLHTICILYIYRCNDIPINRNWLAPLWNQSKLRRNPSTSKTTYRKKQFFNTYINSGVKNSKKRLRNSREKKSDHIFHFISAMHPIFPLGNCVALLKISVKLLDILM